MMIFLWEWSKEDILWAGPESQPLPLVRQYFIIDYYANGASLRISHRWYWHTSPAHCSHRQIASTNILLSMTDWCKEIVLPQTHCSTHTVLPQTHCSHIHNAPTNTLLSETHCYHKHTTPTHKLLPLIRCSHKHTTPTGTLLSQKHCSNKRTAPTNILLP